MNTLAPMTIDPSDEVVGNYLRLLAWRRKASGRSGRNAVLAKLFAAEEARLAVAEHAFIDVGRAWSRRVRISGRTLHEGGVPKAVLARAGIECLDAADTVRAGYPRGTFVVRALVEQLGVTAAVVRVVIEEDLSVGRLIEVAPTTGRGRPARQFRRARGTRS